MIVMDFNIKIAIGFYHVKLPHHYVYSYNILFRICGTEVTLRTLLNRSKDEGGPF